MRRTMAANLQPDDASLDGDAGDVDAREVDHEIDRELDHWLGLPLDDNVDVARRLFEHLVGRVRAAEPAAIAPVG